MVKVFNIPKIVRDADSIWHEIRWSATNGVPTCTCGCDELYILGDGRYKCKKCGKVFSDKSGTLLHHSKLSIDKWLVAIFVFSNQTECSAIDLQKAIDVNYKTAYMILQKLRYVVGKGELSLEGVVRIDEAYIGAEWKNVHFNRKMDYMRSNGFIEANSRKYTKQQLLRAVSAKKCHILSLTDEHNTTRLIHTPNPITKDIIKQIIFDKHNNITEIISDESQLYKNIGIPVYQSNHSKHIFVTANGRTSNICENRFSWFKRKWNGVYTHTSEKYLQLYLNQRQFHFNNKGKSVDERFYALLGLCVSTNVTCKDIYEFNYQDAFPKSRRQKEKEVMEDLLQCPFINAVEDRYGRRYNRSSK